MDKAPRDRDAERRSCEREEAETGAQGHTPRTARGFQKLKEAGRIFPRAFAGSRGLPHLISDSQPPACERTDFHSLTFPQVVVLF